MDVHIIRVYHKQPKQLSAHPSFLFVLVHNSSCPMEQHCFDGDNSGNERRDYVYRIIY